MAQANHIERVAIIGFTGRLGSHFIESLLATGKHTVTAITRAGGNHTVLSGARLAEVNYDDGGDSLVAALRGQQFLIITLSISAPPDTHSKIVEAAARAGVPYIMPNIHGFDIFNDSLREESVPGSSHMRYKNEVEESGAKWVVMVSGFWYEWSLALGEPCFGFDIKNKTVTFFDDGKTAINVSTWKRCGRALAALLSLPIDGASPAFSDWIGKPLYFDSFLVSQRDMLDSLNRVLGTTDADWTITSETTAQRQKDGQKELAEGSMRGFAKLMYSRVFFPGGGGDYTGKGLANDALGLPKDDLDEATKRAVELAESDLDHFV
ncbi:NAD(P)-binding protein [Tothia fuscella]|uniref:NAD(P)-binding protein n=1 Tax=Tothia fuscella TaxID=1048955 RepID=A0A9P4TVA9_9PEZI|nr:NAD(P)-binding protein [Tothia fuscella]